MFTPTEGKKSWRKRALFIVAALALLVALFGRGTIKEGLAWLNGMQTYVYAFPMMVMDKTREVWTAVPEAGAVLCTAQSVCRDDALSWCFIFSGRCHALD